MRKLSVTFRLPRFRPIPAIHNHQDELIGAKKMLIKDELFQD
jgi:hypothetical protein